MAGRTDHPAAGKGEALDEEKITAWYPVLFRTALRLTGSATDAADLTQQAFCRAIEHWDRFQHNSSPLTWMYRILINGMKDWARGLAKAKDSPWPAALDKADYVIVGEAFSEFALRTGDLVTCAARGEINVIERKTGRIVLPDRADARAVDLAEALAGKTALQSVARVLGLRGLSEFATILPAGAPASQSVGAPK
ncbi:MAG: sigma-70 family RNA polymerase sigma factor [Planctomycetota bacterium]|nr:sigma-70 family RNA polymerase sigma factor [Planctomycetota bacterium]